MADPETGKKRFTTAGTPVRRDAERAAAKWEDDIREGRDRSPSKMAWSDFREKYETEVLPGLGAGHRTQGPRCLQHGRTHPHAPTKLRQLTTERLSFMVSKLREGNPAAGDTGQPISLEDKPRSENTIKGILAHLAAALAWAVEVRLLHVAPKIKAPRRAKASKMMKGRPITLEEFERMLAVVPKIVLDDPLKPKGRGKVAKPLTAEQMAERDAIVESWRHYLQGLWLSGLRLGESLELFWDRDDRLCVDLSAKRLMMRIPGALRKRKQRPIAPDGAGLRRIHSVANAEAARRLWSRLQSPAPPDNGSAADRSGA